MSIESELVFPAPLEVDLDDFLLQGDNSFRIWLRFADGAYLAIDLQPGTQTHQELVDVLEEVVNDGLQRLAEHRLVLTGLTPPTDGGDVEDDTE